jgi:hypothetical protein
MNITIYDDFAPGDKLRLVHLDHGQEDFVTDAELLVTRDAVSATFSSVKRGAHDDVKVIIERASRKQVEEG